MDKNLAIRVDGIDEPRQLERRTLDETYLAGVLESAPAYAARGSAELSAYLTRLTGREVLLEGAVTIAVQSACRRCLEPVESEWPVVFTLRLVPVEAGASAKAGRRGDDDAGESERDGSFEDAEVDEEPFDGETIHLGELVREQLLLGLPGVEPLCGEACKGLCATCGANRNAADCGHSAKPPDPRWAALRDLKV